MARETGGTEGDDTTGVCTIIGVKQTRFAQWESPMTDCLSASELEGYHAGDVSASGSARFEAHLESCLSCRARSDQVLAELEALGADAQRVFAVANENVETVPSPNRPRVNATVNPVDLQAISDSIPGYSILREIHRGGHEPKVGCASLTGRIMRGTSNLVSILPETQSLAATRVSQRPTGLCCHL